MKKKKLTADKAREMVESQADLIKEMGNAILAQKKNFSDVCAFQKTKLDEKTKETADLQNKVDELQNLADLRLRELQQSWEARSKYQSEDTRALLCRLYRYLKLKLRVKLYHLRQLLAGAYSAEEPEYFWDPPTDGGYGVEISKPKRR